MDSNFNLSTDQVDAMQELGNIASGNAASALATMLGDEIKVGMPVVKFLDYEDVAERFGGSENIHVCVMLSLAGDLNGMVLFVLEPEFASYILENLVGEAFDINEAMSEFSESAIKEVGNIMIGSYVGGLAGITGLTIDITPPSITVDMIGSILSVPNIYYANMSDKMIYIEDGFVTSNKPSGRILLMPDIDSLTKIMESIGME